MTVGSQLPFDRLVRAVDEWAEENDRDDVFAQIGASSYRPRRLEATPFLPSDEFARRLRGATLVVAHAGIGTILLALEIAKPLLVMPRQSARGEHRNDHQVATAERLGGMGCVTVASTAEELEKQLDQLDSLVAADRIPAVAPAELTRRIDAFVHGGSIVGGSALPLQRRR